MRNRTADSVAAEEFPDWHPAAHGFVEESIARDNGGDYAGEFRVPELPLQAVPGNFEDGSSGEMANRRAVACSLTRTYPPSPLTKRPLVPSPPAVPSRALWRRGA